MSVGPGTDAVDGLRMTSPVQQASDVVQSDAGSKRRLHAFAKRDNLRNHNPTQDFPNKPAASFPLRSHQAQQQQTFFSQTLFSN